jgi:putative sterol carrier protein
VIEAEPTSTDVFGGIAKYLAKTGGQGDKIKTVFQFKLKSPDATWTIDLASGDGKVGQGETAPPGCTLEITDADFMDMCTGKADAMKLFTGGKLKITGNIMASQKLDFLRKVDPSDVLAAMKERTGAGGGAAPKAAAPAASSGSASSGAGKAKDIAKKIGDRIAANANLAKPDVNVIGVGMVKFQEAGAQATTITSWHGPTRSARDALEGRRREGRPSSDIEQAFAGYVYGDSTCGQRAVYEVGLTGIPVFNVNNNCSTGSTALMLARQAVEGGLAECVLAVGFEQMEKGALGQVQRPHEPARSPSTNVMNDVQGFNQAPPRRADVRRRRPRVPLEVRHQARDLRQDRREGPQARQPRTPRALPPRRSPSRRSSPRPRSSIRSRATSAARPPAAPRPPILCSDEFAKKHGLQTPSTSPPRR